VQACAQGLFVEGHLAIVEGLFFANFTRFSRAHQDKTILASETFNRNHSLHFAVLRTQ
jgi:hypothetical protein